MSKFDMAVIGAGASGLVAAITAARLGRSVMLCDRMPRIGKKILASGNGRCNLLNEELNETFYNTASRHLVAGVFSRFGKTGIEKFFESLGLKIYSEEGRVFPATNQSASVLKVLELELKRLRIPVELDFDACRITADPKDGFVIVSKSGSSVHAAALVIAAGGRSYPALGSDGSAYKLAQSFGHTIVEPVPAGVALIVKDPFCHILQGQKISANVKGVISQKTVCEASGEVLFTKYGLSGTAILDVSDEISISINRHARKDAVVSVDMIPFMDNSSLALELGKRRSAHFSPEDMTTGILPNKFGTALKNIFKTPDPAAAADSLKDWRFKVAGTRGWNEADFTAGGIDASEIKENTMESRLKKGLYFAGEILDVNGKRGGYNLAWAWASGYVAGSGQ